MQAAWRGLSFLTMQKTLYLNIEDDIQTVIHKLARLDATEVVLVFPKRSFLFADPINFKLLKKQTDYLGKTISVLTMDDVGRLYAKEAGFTLRSLERQTNKKFSDINFNPSKKTDVSAYTRAVPALPVNEESVISHTEVSNFPAKTKKTPMPAQPFLMVKDTAYPEQESRSGKPVKMKAMKSPRKFAWKLLFGFLIPALLIAVLVVMFILPEGKIIVYPKTESVVRDLEISAGTGINDIDADKMLLPATKLTKTLSLQENFESSGKKEVGTKASGKVRIINLTGKPINLKSSTTVLSLGDKTYRFTDDLSAVPAIPPKLLQSGNYSPTIVDVSAENGGESYNLPGGTRLEITNQVFGSQPQLLYAKVESSIVGGVSRFISVVSEEDVKRAQNILLNRMVEQVRTDLSSQSIILPNKAFISEIIDLQTSKPVGTESPNFQLTLKTTIKALVLNKSQLVSLVENRILRSLPESHKLTSALDGNLTLEAKNYNFDQGLMLLSIRVDAISISELRLNGVEAELLGKSRQEVSAILLAKPQVERIDIILSPYWQKNMPKFATKIKIELAQ